MFFNSKRNGSWRAGVRGAGAALLLALVPAACDFEVTNPGPVEDEFLDRATAHVSMANGIMVQLADALTNVAYTTGAVTREIFPAGSTGSFGISGFQQIGLLRYNDQHVEAPWNAANRARRMTEDFYVRMDENEEVELAEYEPAVLTALWGGYTYRLLGDAFCQAVIDGGAAQDNSVYWERAEEWFTETIALAGTEEDFEDYVTAAYAGRASVRASLGDWTGAMADAGMVDDDDFSFNMEYTTQQQSQYNRIYWAAADRPYRAHTVWNTFYEDYYTDTNDPRTPWRTDPDEEFGDASLAMLGNQRATWYPQMKHDTPDAPHELSSGWEMRLLEAEDRLMAGDFGVATMELINRHRVELGLAPWVATTLEEAWEALKRERGIELWLNARRIADLRRWEENNAPGDLSTYETPGHPDSYLNANRSLCYQIPENEYETNENLGEPPTG